MERERAMQHARALQANVNATIDDERDNEALMERLDRMIGELHEVAESWDKVDKEMAVRVRDQEQQLHELRAKLARLGQLEAEEVSKLNSSILRDLRIAGGDGKPA
jgi:replication fork clamp-binding protein CrfC